MNLRECWNGFLRSWSAHAPTQFATLAVLAGCYSVVLCCLLIQTNLNTVLSRWGEGVQFSVYLTEEASQDQLGKIEKTLRTENLFSSVKYISKAQAESDFRVQMGSSVPSFLDSEDFGNPFPASFETTIEEKADSLEVIKKLEAVATSLMALAGVEDVSFGQDWVKNYATLSRGFATASGVLMAILLFGSLFVVGNSIRSSIHSRRDEVEVLELVGASRAYIRSPFIFEGMVMGAAASLLAVIASYFLYRWAISGLMESIGFWARGADLHFFHPFYIAMVIVTGMMAGAVGSALCVRRLSSGWAAARRTDGRLW